MSMLTIMDLKAAPSDTLEHTLMLALARPAHYTQVCLKGLHTRSHLHGEFETCLALWQSIMCHTHVVSNEKNMLPQKTHASPCLLSLEHCITRTPNNLSVCPLLQPRTFALCSTSVFALQPSARAYVPSSQALSSRTLLHTLLRPNTTLSTLHSAIKRRRPFQTTMR